jgi:hypothetical protein
MKISIDMPWVYANNLAAGQLRFFHRRHHADENEMKITILPFSSQRRRRNETLLGMCDTRFGMDRPGVGSGPHDIQRGGAHEADGGDAQEF